MKAHEGITFDTFWGFGYKRLHYSSLLVYLLSEFVSSLLAGGKGAAFQVLPDSGLLGPFETQTVDVTAYTDMWGEYRDDLISKVCFTVLWNEMFSSSSFDENSLSAAGRRSRTSSYFDEDDSEGMSSLLPTSKRPVSDTKHIVRYTGFIVHWPLFVDFNDDVLSFDSTFLLVSALTCLEGMQFHDLFTSKIQPCSVSCY